MLRLENVLAQVHEKKTCSRRQLYRYFQELGIKPIGARQRPQFYPADAPARVLAHLGLMEPAKGGGRIVTLNQLRAARGKAGRAA